MEEEKQAVTNKWDVLMGLNDKIKQAASKMAYSADKEKTGKEYMGDPTADNQAAIAELYELKELYDKVLKAE